MSTIHPRTESLAAALRAVLADPASDVAREHATRELAAFDAMRAGVGKARKRHQDLVAPVMVGGHRFTSIRSAYHAAQREGFNGSEAAFHARVKRGLGWADLTKPIDAERSRLRRESDNRKHAAMHRVLAEMNIRRVPKDFPVRPILNPIGIRGAATCNTCHLSWDADAHPTPSARCPFEAYHP